MFNRNLVCFLLFVLPAAIALASNDETLRDPDRPFPSQEFIQTAHAGVFHGQPWSTHKAVGDTIYLLGGDAIPNLGDFQDLYGEPAWDDWTHHDLTITTESHWHCDDYNCQNLDPDTVPNHAWWCGRYFSHDCDSGDYGGYGNFWNEYLVWYGTVSDPSLATTVRVTAKLNHDVEPDYDFLYLEFESFSQGWVVVQTFNGTATDVIVDETFVVSQLDYTGPTSDQIRLRWRFFSDWAWSDADCNYISLGAAQIDLIDVYFDQGDGSVPMGTTEDCEGPNQWSVEFPAAVGDFAKVWPLLFDIDACASNSTCQVAFIDDGVVVPGTGGYLCTTWCYGPGGYIVNPEGGLAGPFFGIHNQIRSPILAWPSGGYDGAIYEFDVYRHETLAPTSPYIYYQWHVRSTASDNPTDIEAADWLNRNHIHYGGPEYYRGIKDVTDLMVPGRKFVQLSLSVWDVFLYYPGTDGYPAPYFDNVSFKVYSFGGPAISTRAADVFQDNFPAIGTIDYDDLSSNSVRVDGTFTYSGTPADTATFDIAAVRTGSVMTELPRLYYKLFPNPLFDPHRTSGLPSQGWVFGDSTRSADGEVVPNRFTFDLPDTGFFFPGDRLHYYIEARDNVGGDVGVTTLPGDTTGFSHAPDMAGYVSLAYPSSFVVRALPTLFSQVTGDHPEVLFWNDYGNLGNEDEWIGALNNLGYREGTDYDLYYTNAPYSGIANGLGGRATATQLSGYDVILYSAGDLFPFTLKNVDAEVLDGWLRSTGGGKNMLLTGDALVSDLLDNADGPALQFVSNWIGVNLVASDLRPLIDDQVAPRVRSLDGNSVFYGINQWTAFGGCPEANVFDAVVPQTGVETLAEFLSPGGESGQYPFAAATMKHVSTYDADIIYLPYDLMFISSENSDGDGDDVLSARAHVLREILFYFGKIGTSPTVPVPESGVFSARCYPNPFNPSTKIEYNLPQPGKLAIKIYSVRGELVKTLLDEFRPPGSGAVVWDGTDTAGRAVASGVYFYEVRTPTDEKIEKIALVR